MVGGASGGTRIITATAQVILNKVARGMSLIDAVTAPRLHYGMGPDSALLEDGHTANGQHVSHDLMVDRALKAKGLPT